MGKKCALDKFYTKENIGKTIVSYIDQKNYDLIIEPSAGAGSISELLDKKKTVAIDLEPEQNDILNMDWFDYKIPQDKKSVLVIGNPPFGNRNNLSKKFIKHALKFDNVKTIAFILPNVYKKHTNQMVFPENWRLARIIDLPYNSFILNGDDYNVPCSFFVWTQFSGITNLRFKKEIYQNHPDFDIVTDCNDADFFVMGASPKVIKELNEINKNNRGYYIKSKIDKDVLKYNFRNIDWFSVGYSSANGGVSWFSKSELIKAYDENKKI